MQGDYGVEVHERVAPIIGRPDSELNSAHKAIAKLAMATRERLAITNFDEHLTTILPNTRRYFAPALPMGDNLEGLIYLHECLSDGIDELIITDRDFRRANLTDAWAARFPPAAAWRSQPQISSSEEERMIAPSPDARRRLSKTVVVQQKSPSRAPRSWPENDGGRHTAENRACSHRCESA